MNDLVRTLEWWVEREPEHPLYSFLDGAGQVIESYTYRSLHERSNYLAANLSDSGRVRHGSPVLLVYSPGLEVMAAFLACVKVGALPVPVPPPEMAGLLGGLERLAHIQADARATVALTNQRCLNRVRALAGGGDEAARRLGREPLASLEWLPTDRLQGVVVDFPSRPHPLLFLQYTSGSTQDPRGVMVSHQNVLHNCQATLDHRPVSVTWLPHYHDMGLIGCYLFGLVAGMTLYGFAAIEFLRRPLYWLETISRVGATMTAAPNFAFDYCLREDKVPTAALAGLDLRSLRYMTNGAEPVGGTTVVRFREKFARCGLAADALVAAYGLAEHTLTVSRYGRILLPLDRVQLQRDRLRISPPATPSRDPVTLASCGLPAPGGEVRVVDPDHRVELPENVIGEIWVRGPSKATGYWKRPELSREVFDARIVGQADGEGYLRTGDVGFLHESELFVCGRRKDLIIVRGRNYYPQDIEAVVERCAPEVRPGGVAAFAVEGDAGQDELVILAEVNRSRTLPNLGWVCAEVKKRCFLEVRVLALVPPGTVAKTSSGKIARSECKRRWLTGQIQTLAVSRPSARETPHDFFASLLDYLDPDSDDRTLAELGIDSLELVGLSLQVQKLLEAAGVPGAAELFDLRILQALTLGEMRRLFEEAMSQGRLPVPTTWTGKMLAVERAERAWMQQDAVLAADVAPAGSPQSAARGRVLLTGATGFLGSFLLEALLRLSDVEVVALVRGQDDRHARSRLEAALDRTGLADPALAEAFRERVVARRADLAAPRLGLSEGCWDALTMETTAVYHCGASVDYVKPYTTQRAANVGGTAELLRLASRSPVKPFHLVSTTFIFGWTNQPLLRETDSNPDMQELNFGYAQSKWVAEQLTYEAARRGLPVRVYRLSLVTASRKARYVHSDIIARLLTYLIRHRIGIDCTNQVSLLPVDVVARNLVALSLLDRDLPAATFHLTADRYYALPDVLGEITREFGYSFCFTDLAGFVEHLNAHCTEADLLYPLMPFINQNYQRFDRMRDKRYDSSGYRRARALSPLTVAEPPLAETVAAIMHFLIEDGLVSPCPPSQVASPGGAR